MRWKTLWIAILSIMSTATMAMFVGCSGGSSPGGPDGEPTSVKDTSTPGTNQAPKKDLIKNEVTVDIVVPSEVTASELAIVGSEVDIGERARIVTRHARFASVGNVGPAVTTLAAGAQLGSLFSVGSVAMFEGAHVHGRLRTSGTVQSAGNFMADDGVSEGQPVPTRHLVRRASFGTANGSVLVTAGQTLGTPVQPGAYDSLRIAQGGTATIGTGSYLFKTVVLEPGATLTIDDSKGAAFVYVEKEFDHAGKIVRAGGGYPRWLVSYLGDGTAFLRAPFPGSVIAPKGSIRLAADPVNHGRHEGSFFAKAVHAEPDSEVVLHDFPWIIRGVTFSPAPTACNGESIHLKVDAEEPAAPGTPARVTLDGMPISEMFDQIASAPGKHLYTVRATSADGMKETQLVPIDVTTCAGNTPAPRPMLFAQENVFHADTADFSVVNAKIFQDAGATYDWDFGDGTTLLGSQLAAVSHDYTAVVPADAEYKAFDVTVTVKRAGQADVNAKRTFVVWSTYGMSKARGVLEPPTVAKDPRFRIDGTDFVGEIEFKNLELDALTYDQRRIDQIPCNADDAPTYGNNESVSISVPARATIVHPLRLAQASVSTATCGVAIHYWGATSAGTKARVTVQFERPGKAGQGIRVTDQMANLLNYAADKGLVTSGQHIGEEEIAKLYRERKIPSSAIDYVPANVPLASTVARVTCDPENPGTPPQPGFTCQPTGAWEGTGPGEQPLDERIENALKGDTIVVRSCTGMVGPLLGAVDPPQKYTHSGIMTKHRFEITHSTGDDDYLVKEHPSGVFGQPTDGFQEHALRYLWPGTITASVREAFAGEGRLVTTPEGKPWRVRGFERLQVRCPGDAQIVYPRVIKPPPEFEQATRPRLMAAADAAKTIRGHYRFATYSNAPDTDAPDPNGPPPIGDQTYGKTPTVCSTFVRLALKKAGFELDRDKSFPKPSDVRNGPPDGIFFYDVQERKNAGNTLYAGLYNTVQYQLAMAASEIVDESWWAGSQPYSGALWNGAGVLSKALASTGPLAGWATDAPDDIANQITNCFASDYCAEEAKDSENWKEPGNGFAVSPDNLLDHYDSPATGGPYGYSERMIYRGKDYRAVYEWRPSPGTMQLPALVVTLDGQSVPFAQVEVRGFTPNPLTADGNGRVLIEGVPRGNIMVHAQKFIGDELRAGDSCYVPADPSNPSSQGLRLVDCHDFGRFLDNEVRFEARVVLNPPRGDFRNVIFDAQVDLKDCDCMSEDEWAHPALHRLCVVNPLHRDDWVEMSPNELCSDEVGLRFRAHCQLLGDNRTVHVWQELFFYEATSPTCGGNEQEDYRFVEYDVGQDATIWPAQQTLTNGGTCGFSSCDDFATVRNFSVWNRRAD